MSTLTPSEGPVHMDLVTNHLSSAAARAWKPDKPRAQLLHLMSCPTCRHAVGRGMLFRGLISPAVPTITNQHLSHAEIVRFHDFVFLAAPDILFSSDDFIRIYSHLRSCNKCLAELLQVQNTAKPSENEIASFINNIEDFSLKIGLNSTVEDTARIELLGGIDIILLPKGIKVEFLPAPGISNRVRLTVPARRSRPSLEARLGLHHIIENRTISAYSKASRDAEGEIDRGDIQIGPTGKIADRISLLLGRKSIVLDFSRYPSGTKIGAKIFDQNTNSPIQDVRLSCQAKNPRLTLEDSLTVTSTDKSGMAELRAPDMVLSPSSTSSKLSPQGWRIKFEDRSVNEVFELDLKLRRSGNR